jgi:dihydrofolate reductase
MRKLITSTFVTLDGVMQGAGGLMEGETFDQAGWQFPYWCDEIEDFGSDIMSQPFDLVLGRKTYEFFAGFWPTASDDIDAKKPFNDAVKYVASHGRPELTWDNSQLIEGDVVEGIKAIKQTEGPDLQVHGSGDLIQSLLRGGVIDEMRVLTHPITVGSGKRLFDEGSVPMKFDVAKTVVSPNGVVMSIYRPNHNA